MARDGLAMLAELVIEDGRRWGEAAADFQLDDAEAIFSPDKPHRHFITRPRGGSKSTDIAGVALAWLTTEARPLANGHVVASTSEQAAIVIDAAAGFVARTPELEGAVRVENERLVAPNGAWVRVLSQSDSGAWGLRDAHLLILDEFCQWPETRGAKRVYEAIRSTVQKVPGCRLIILTSAGEPSHWSYGDVFVRAKQDPLWRVAETPGPVPWQDPEELESLRAELSPSAYDRLILNIWSESEDRAITPEDYEVAKEPGFPYGTVPAGLKGACTRLHHPQPGIKYILTIDIGIYNDATVLCVAHKEPVDPEEPKGIQRVVVDHLERWQGSKKHPVQVAPVEERARKLALEYNRAKIYADPDQFLGSLQALNRKGVHAEAWAFTATSVGQVATALTQTFRNRQIVVPHTAALREELLKVRLRESAPGVTRLDHTRSGHDDQAVCIGLACHLLLGGAKGFGSARAFIEAAQGAAEIVDERRRMRSQDADIAPRDRRRVRQLVGRRQGTDAAQQRQQQRCAHRWRGARCVFCGGEREPVAH